MILALGIIGLAGSLAVISRLIVKKRKVAALLSAVTFLVAYGSLQLAQGPEIWSYLAVQLGIAGGIGIPALLAARRYRVLGVFAVPVLAYAMVAAGLAPPLIAFIGEISMLFAPMLLVMAVAFAAGAFLEKHQAV